MPMTSITEHTQRDPAADQAIYEAAVSQVLDEAKAQGATSSEAGISCESGFSTTVRLGDVETVEHHRDRGMGVTVYFGQRKGSASTSDLSAGALRDAVRAACDIAKYTSEDECAGLADADCMATEIPDLDLYHPWDLDPDGAIDIALECEEVARGYDKRITNSEGVTINTHQTRRVYANSHGFLAGYPSSSHSLSCVLIGEQDGAMQRDYWYTSARDASELESAVDVGKRAAERTVRRLGARRIPTCQTPVIFAAEMASGLVGSFISAIRGGAQYRKTTFLLNKLGAKVFPEWVHIHEQPRLLKGLASSPYDGEGVATTDRDFVVDGVVQSYVLDSYSARKLGRVTTGNAGGVRNLSIDSGSNDFAQLLKMMGKGLLVTEMMGHGTNMMTGDYSRGASGFWVEDGEIAYPVEEITVAGNLSDMFQGLLAVGSDVDLRGRIRTGSHLIDNMTIAGE